MSSVTVRGTRAGGQEPQAHDSADEGFVDAKLLCEGADDSDLAFVDVPLSPESFRHSVGTNRCVFLRFLWPTPHLLSAFFSSNEFILSSFRFFEKREKSA